MPERLVALSRPRTSRALELECVPFNLEIPEYENVPRNFDSLKAFLSTLESKYAPGHVAEGIVFHHPDGRRAKIKRKDFAGMAVYRTRSPNHGDELPAGLVMLERCLRCATAWAGL